MADQITTTKTLDVQCMDVNGALVTYKIDNYQDSVTKIAVINAFENAIGNQLLISSKSGALLQRVAKVTKSESIKTILDNQTIYITPSSIDITSGLGTTTITVTDGVCQGINVENFSVSINGTAGSGNAYFLLFADVSSNGATVTVQLIQKPGGLEPQSGPAVATAEIKLIIGGLEYNVPYKNSWSI